MMPCSLLLIGMLFRGRTSRPKWQTQSQSAASSFGDSGCHQYLTSVYIAKLGNMVLVFAPAITYVPLTHQFAVTHHRPDRSLTILKSSRAHHSRYSTRTMTSPKPAAPGSILPNILPSTKINSRASISSSKALILNPSHKPSFDCHCALLLARPKVASNPRSWSHPRYAKCFKASSRKR